MKSIKIIRFILITISIVIISTIIVFTYITALEKPKAYYKINQEKKKTDEVYFIGDSWAQFANNYGFNERMDSLVLNKGLHINTRSIGFCGKTSKEIYELLFIKGKNGLRDIIEKKPKYIILSCGINDQHAQYGPQFYAHYTSLIIKLLLHYNIKVLYIELPQWDIDQSYKYYNIVRRSYYIIAAYLTTKQLDYNSTVIYRNALLNIINKEKSNPQRIIIRSDLLNHKKYWKDFMHLNNYGYNLLSLIIAKNI